MCCWQLPAGKPRAVESQAVTCQPFTRQHIASLQCRAACSLPPEFAGPGGKAGCVSCPARCRDFDPIMRHQPGVRVTWELSELGGGREGTVPSHCLSSLIPQRLRCPGNQPRTGDRRALGWLTGTRGSWQSRSDGVFPLESQCDNRWLQLSFSPILAKHPGGPKSCAQVPNPPAIPSSSPARQPWGGTHGKH